MAIQEPQVIDIVDTKITPTEPSPLEPDPVHRIAEALEQMPSIQHVDLKLRRPIRVLFDFVCRKGIIFTKKSMDSFTLWWRLAMRGGKGILGVVLWHSGILLMVLPCIMGIWCP